MSEVTAVDRLYDALGRGDAEGMRMACTPGALFWHSFDQTAQDLDAAVSGWAAIVANSAERGIFDVRRQATADGYVQQHLYVMRTTAGKRVIWPVCLVVQIEDGLVARIDEYIDRAGSFLSEDDAPETPGF